MAYIAFQGFDEATAVRLPLHSATAALSGTERLTDLEWQVVAIARWDRPSSLRQPGWITTFMRMVFNQPNPMLTDPRLEALRRMAVLTWRRGYAVAPHEVRAFFNAGFTAGQYQTMADHIGAARILTPNSVRR